MSLEHSSYESDQLPKKPSILFEHAVRSFNGGCKMDHDAINVWGSLSFVLPGLSQTWDRVTPRRHYKEYVMESDKKNNENQKYADFVMERSDPQAVAAFDALVDEFNADLERIKREKDYNALKNFLARAKELVYSKKA